MSAPIAVTLREMADKYQRLAEHNRLMGRHAEAEGNLRVMRDCLIAADELESRLAQADLQNCQDHDL